MPTWNSTSTSSSSTSSSSERFHLNNKDTKDILVYKYRQGVKDIEVGSQQKLCQYLDKDDPQGLKWRVSRKKIPRGDARVDVRMEDLFTEDERSEFSRYPSSKNSIASVGLPSFAKWKHILFNSFPELYIVSPVSSPENSLHGSPESSQHVSPSSTFPRQRHGHDEGEGESKSGTTQKTDANRS